MSRPPRIPCRQATRNYAFMLNGDRRIIQPGISEAEAAGKIPLIFGPGVKWAIGVKSGKKYEY